MNRYQIIETIAQGDFAIVYRARDQELNREVAIKQIHAQYLADPRQLDRYWQEAQLLASLEHPHIMTIYDVVRERGWLILELMQGSLQQLLGDNPIDLKDLRLTLNYSLHAMQFMHDHGIVHGDVKPSNLMVDRNHRVKLGDFGIARRIAGDEGSVVKGTTKYMAPEVVSDQFGEVGPHSDLYSLGFTAYELMCGSNFDSLFPGLNMYGRDRQMAWLMWHAAPDRKAPQIERVLQGVPPDLTHIVQKLIEKDPQRRYRTAQQVLDDLSLEGQLPHDGPTAEEVVAAEQQARQTRRRRSLAIAAVACSLVLTVGVLLLPSGSSDAPPAVRAERPRAGRIVEIDPPRYRIFVEAVESGVAQGITIDPQADRVHVNGQRAEFADLLAGDTLSIRYLRSDEEEFKEIFAVREVSVKSEGTIDEIDVYAKTLTVSWSKDPSLAAEVSVGDAVAITLNGQSMLDGRRVRLDDLRTTDRVIVAHKSGENERRTAVSLRVLRELSLSGFVDQVRGDELAVRIASQWDAPQAVRKTLRVADDCIITLNGRQSSDGQPVVLRDLRPQDGISLRHDELVHRIEAFRAVSTTGKIAAINYNKQNLQIAGGDDALLTFTTTADCRIEVNGEQASVDFNFLRQGDRVTVHRRSPDPQNREAVLISLTAQPDPSAWAIVVGHDNYDNRRLPQRRFALADAEALRDALRVHYRVPATQLRYWLNSTRSALEDNISQFVSQVPAGAQLIVYFLGHGYVAGGAGYLAPQGFNERQAEATGLSLNWLIQRLESSPARETLLLLDTTPAAEGRVPSWYVSAAELAVAAKPGPQRPLSKSVRVIASCEQGQVGLELEDEGRGMFASAVSTALRGSADVDQDHRISGDELFGFVAAEVSQRALQQNLTQTAVDFLPDATPPRLTQQAKDSVVRILSHLRGRMDAQLQVEYDNARRLMAGEPDAELAYALVQLKHDRTLRSLQIFEQVRVQHPDALPAYHALAWQYFQKSDFAQGIENLERFVLRLPEEQDAATSVYADHVIHLAGQLVGYAILAAPQEKRLELADIAALNEAVRQRNAETKDLYSKGYTTVLEKEQSASDRDRARLSFYAELDYSVIQSYLVSSLQR